MRAVVMAAGGGPGVLQLTQLPPPNALLPTDVLVRVHAAGVNPIDTKMRAQPERFPVRLPLVLGCDGAGVVEAVGPEVTRFRPGDEVYYCACGFGERQGSYAEWQWVDEAVLAHKPETLSFAQAAVVPLVLITAWEALFDRARLQAGQCVLVQGAAGGVGHIALQLARIAGARVCASVGSAAKADLVRTLGADCVVDHTRQDLDRTIAEWTEGEGVDVLLDTVGGKLLQHNFRWVRHYGDVVTILQPAPDTDWSEARTRNLRISLELMLTPSMAGLRTHQSRQGDILRQAAAMFDEGRLRVVLAREFPLDAAAEAQRFLIEERPAGKVVLRV